MMNGEVRKLNAEELAGYRAAIESSARQRRIVIFVEGGVVQAVYAPRSLNLEVQLIDFDNLEDEGVSRDEREDKLTTATVDLVDVGF